MTIDRRELLARYDVIMPDDPGRPRRLGWAVLLKRTYAVDVLVCARCQGRWGSLLSSKTSASHGASSSTSAWPRERRRVDGRGRLLRRSSPSTSPTVTTTSTPSTRADRFRRALTWRDGDLRAMAAEM